MNKSVLKRGIILAWIFLIACFIIKLFGGNWFEIIVKDERFISIGKFIDNTAWLNTIICVITSYLANQLYLLAVCREIKFSYKINIFLLLYVIFSICVKTFLGNTLGLVCDIIQLGVIPFILLGKPSKKHWNILIGIILNISFQIISAITKNIGINFIDENLLIGLIFMIDLYIMLILYYLYSLYYKKEEKL